MKSVHPGNRIEIVVQDRFGHEEVACRGLNTTTYEGQNALGLVLSGQIDAHFNGAYFGFDATGVSGPVATSINSVAADFHALTGDQDVARVKLGTHPTDASTGNYADNRVLVSGAVDAETVGIINSKVLVGGTAEVTHVALIVAEDWDDYTKDKAYAVFTPGSPVLVPSGGSASMRWLPKFEL